MTRTDRDYRGRFKSADDDRLSRVGGSELDSLYPGGAVDIFPDYNLWAEAVQNRDRYCKAFYGLVIRKRSDGRAYFLPSHVWSAALLVDREQRQLRCWLAEYAYRHGEAGYLACVAVNDMFSFSASLDRFEALRDLVGPRTTGQDAAPQGELGCGA